MKNLKKWKNRRERNRWNCRKRLAAFVLAAFLAASAVRETARMEAGEWVPAQEQPALLAWWGTLYPDFCFGVHGERADDKKNAKEPWASGVKISFWLAQALDW